MQWEDILAVCLYLVQQEFPGIPEPLCVTTVDCAVPAGQLVQVLACCADDLVCQDERDRAYLYPRPSYPIRGGKKNVRIFS